METKHVRDAKKLNNIKHRKFKKTLNKNQSVKLYKEKHKRRVAFTEQRENLKKRYDEIDFSKIDKFEQLPLTLETLKGLKKCNYTVLTEIQQQAIIPALKGLDILGAAKTGSGKTLAFIIPILERLFCEGWGKNDSLGVLVITPTRELAMQIHEVCVAVGEFHRLKMGLVIGGKDLYEEKKILNEYNIVICTPGRLLQHLDQNPLLDVMNLQMLVLDEADRILDMGFQKEMNAILEHLPQNRQTLLFSATQTKSVKDLARLSLKNPVYVSVHEHAKYATPSGLEQSYIVVELPKKMDFLWSFLKNHKNQKILIFMTSCKQVKYTFEVFCRMKPGVSLTALYGGLHQLKRMERYKDFCRKNHVVMFATDLAARGLDFPNVDWVVQMDCPEDVNTYIHRAGRTARYQKGGNSLLVLVPSEKEAMLKYLENRKIPINEIVVHPSKIVSIQRKVELLCARDDNLYESGQRAFKSYFKSVFLMKDKSVFDINQFCDFKLQEDYARSLGLKCCPRIRFIQKRCKDAVRPNSETGEPKVSSPSDNGKISAAEKFGGESSDNSDIDDFCDKATTSVVSCEEELPQDKEVKPKKSMTKEALAKMVIKGKLQPNLKVKFDEEGDPIGTSDSNAKADINVEEHEEFMAQVVNLIGTEDVADRSLFHSKVKRKHKEKKLKLKANRLQNNNETPAQLGGSENEVDEKDDDSSHSSDEEITPKRQRFSDASESEAENPEDSTNFGDDELLALHFLENT